MMTKKRSKARSPSLPRKQEDMEFRLLFIVSFVIFLFVTMVMRCLPWRSRTSASGANGRRSIIGEAKELAHSTIPYAFMA